MKLKPNEFLIWESDRLRCVGRRRGQAHYPHHWRYRWRITSTANGKITHASSEAFNSKQVCLDNANMICCRERRDWDVSEAKLQVTLVSNAADKEIKARQALQNLMNGIDSGAIKISSDEDERLEYTLAQAKAALAKAEGDPAPNINTEE